MKTRAVFVRMAGFILSLFALPGASTATNHFTQLDEVMGGCGGDPRIEFVEIAFPPTQNRWGGCAELAFFDASGTPTTVFSFPGDVPDDSRDRNSALVATQAFADLPGAPRPDFIMPPSLVATPGGKACFRGTGNPGCFAVNMCLSYGEFRGDTEGGGTPASPLPTAGAASLQRFQRFGALDGSHFNADFTLAAPLPRNDDGVVGRVVADESGCRVEPACPGTDLGDAAVVSFAGTALGPSDLVEASCATEHAPDATFLYTAPHTGSYVIDTVGSAIDTALSVRDRTCDGNELACEAGNVGRDPRISVELTAGQQVVVVVDGRSDQRGPFALNVAETCPRQPMATCEPARPRGASLSLVSDGDHRHDRLRWKWKGSVASPIGFGDPLASTDYALCLYSLSGSAALESGHTIPAGGVCDGAPCWKRTRSGFRYRDPERTPAGMTSLRLKARAGRSTVSAKGRGPLLGLAPLPLAPPLLVQLLRLDGGCWEARYSDVRPSLRKLRTLSD